MSGADDLREAILDALWVTKGAWADTDAVMAVLGDPVRRLAILNLIGDVVGDVWLPDYFVSGSTTHFQGFGIEPPGARPEHYFKAVVVRPRGEATDA